MNKPVDPNFLHASRKAVEELVQRVLCQVTFRNARDKDGICLDGFGMGRFDEMLLSRQSKMPHLPFEDVENPDWIILLVA